MSLPKQILKANTAKLLQSFYEYCGYDITDKQIKELAELIHASNDKLTIVQVEEFIYLMKLGELGMIYKSPISIMVAFKQYKEEKLPYKLSITTGAFSR